MSWRQEDPQGNESGKVRWELVPYTRGKVLDLGSGPYITFPHFLRVDNEADEGLFGIKANPQVRVETCEQLTIFASQSWDAVFSSHMLEHIAPERVPAALKEWLRVIKPGGFLVLYLPADDLYPKIGEKGANPDHKWDVSYESMLEHMRKAGSWDLIDYQHRSEDREYSHLFVFKRVSAGQHTSWKKRVRPPKTAAVVRYGAFGDNLQASSVVKGLKDQGYHVTYYGSPPGLDVLTHDPHIDAFVIQDKDQVPNQALGEYWAYIAKKYDRFVNLSESIENTLLSTPGRIQHTWPPALRHQHMNRNYLELQHAIAQVPHLPQVRFYATDLEKAAARREKTKLGGFVVVWSLAGSSGHKTWPFMDQVIAGLMIDFPDVKVVLIGNEAGKILEQGWENEKRVIRQSGRWSIREALAFADIADLVIGPETGVMNAVAQRPMPKVVFLSHSTHENLTRDWVNTHVLASPATHCPGRGENAAPACHQLHYNWAFCKQTPEGVAQCQMDIPGEAAYRVLWHAITWAKEGHVPALRPAHPAIVSGASPS